MKPLGCASAPPPRYRPLDGHLPSTTRRHSTTWHGGPFWRLRLPRWPAPRWDASRPHLPQTPHGNMRDDPVCPTRTSDPPRQRSLRGRTRTPSLPRAQGPSPSPRAGFRSAADLPGRRDTNLTNQRMPISGGPGLVGSCTAQGDGFRLALCTFSVWPWEPLFSQRRCWTCFLRPSIMTNPDSFLRPWSTSSGVSCGA